MRTRVVAVSVGALLAASSMVCASAASPVHSDRRPGHSPSARAHQMPSAEQSYRVWRGGERSLRDHTVFRPVDMAQVPYRMPVVVWANGGCRQSNEEYRYFLTTLASYGVLVVANGAPENPFEVADLGGVAHPEPQQLVDGLDWALRQNATRSSPYYQQLDPKKVLVMGQSCGGWEAVDASRDPRVTSTIVWNSGMNPYHPSGVGELHAPMLLAYGGPLDHVAWDAETTYRLSSVATTLISHPDGGHTNWWDGPADAPTQEMRVPLPIAERWIAFTLYGSGSGKRFFLGDACGLCQQSGWTVTSKNWN